MALVAITLHTWLARAGMMAVLADIQHLVQAIGHGAAHFIFLAASRCRAYHTGAAAVRGSSRGRDVGVRRGDEEGVIQGVCASEAVSPRRRLRRASAASPDTRDCDDAHGRSRASRSAGGWEHRARGLECGPRPCDLRCHPSAGRVCVAACPVCSRLVRRPVCPCVSACVMMLMSRTVMVLGRGYWVCALVGNNLPGRCG